MPETPENPRHQPEPIAIVGMECVFPGARNLEAFWRNIVHGVDAVREAPASRFDPQEYGLGNIRGGFLDGLAEFDPLPLGIMPNAVDEGDPEQFLALGVIHGALKNAEAGRDGRPIAATNERTEVVVGRGGYLGNSVEHMYLRTEVVAQVAAILERLLPEASPEIRKQIRERLTAALPAVTSETVSGSIPNLTCGRAANRLDLMGAGYTVDAACASSLVAVDSVMRSLREGRSDVGIAAGVHLIQKPYFWQAFATLGALSPTGKIAPFSNDADGLVAGEGVGAVVLKRLSDAERDGDRVYAILRSSGIASDGRGAAVLSPRVEGEVLALRRAYDEAGVDPSSISLIEGHGTATSVGDAAEIAALDQVFGKNDFTDIALGSVKSMIGHAMPAAGMAGLIKTALALHHRILPPTLHVEQQHPALAGTRFYVNTTTRPWISPQDTPRRAGVNAFGFGGINAHLVLEQAPSARLDQLTPRSSELFLASAARREELIGRLRQWGAALAPLGEHELRDACYSESRRFQTDDECRMAIVANDLADLGEKLARAARRLENDRHDAWVETDGIYFSREARPGKLAFLFPGIGFPGMAGGYTERLAELCLQFPEVQAVVDAADQFTLHDGGTHPLRHQFFPPPLLAGSEYAQIERELAWSPRAPAGMLMANVATWELMRRMGVAPDAVAGFSLGEWAALVAGGVLDETAIDHFADSKEILRFNDERGSWAVVATSAEQAETVLHRVPGILSVTMDVSPTQVFIGGEKESVRAALVELQKLGVWGHELPVLPFHTPLAEEFAQKLMKMMERMPVKAPSIPVYCGMNGRPYPSEPEKIREYVAQNTCEPVHVRETISQLYRDGVRIFVQLGGGGKFLPNIQNTLALQPHVALSIDLEHRGGLEQLHHVLGRLATLGVALRPEGLFQDRPCREIDPASSTPRRSKTLRALPLAPPRLRPSDETMQWLREKLAPSAARPTMPPPAPMPAFSAAAPRATSSTPHPAAPVRGRSAAASALAAQAVSTLEQFLELQQEEEQAELAMFQQFLAAQEAAMIALATTPAVAEPAPAIETKAFPFLGEITEYAPGQSFTAQLSLDLDKNRFLRDHALLRVPEELKPAADCLPTIPFTFEAEILAEAAEFLAPGMRVSACHDMEATRWISVESGTTLALHIKAQRTGDQVHVELMTASQPRPVFRGKVTLGEEPAPPSPLQMPALAPCAHTAQDFYQRGPLFHRELFQVITALHGIGEGAISAELRVTDTAQMTTHHAATAMIFDPVLLDAVGQVLAYWALLEGWAVFPQRLGRLSRFGATPAPGTTVRANLRFKRLDSRRLHADVDLLRPDGSLWIRMEAWQPWRVLWPKDLLRYRDDRRDGFLAEPHESIDGAIVYRIRRQDIGDMNPEWVARLYLRGDELKTYQERPRLDWLLGRVAAKDAVRASLRETTGKLLHPLEVEITNVESGAPQVRVAGLTAPALSISHIEDHAIAAAGPAEARIGVDVARVGERQLEFRELAFDAGELAVLAKQGGGAAAMHRAWCAKEAALKAFGRGLDSMPHFRCERLSDDGTVEIGAVGEPERLRIRTWIEGDLAYALLVRRA